MLLLMVFMRSEEMITTNKQTKNKKMRESTCCPWSSCEKTHLRSPFLLFHCQGSFPSWSSTEFLCVPYEHGGVC